MRNAGGPPSVSGGRGRASRACDHVPAHKARASGCGYAGNALRAARASVCVCVCVQPRSAYAHARPELFTACPETFTILSDYDYLASVCCGVTRELFTLCTFFNFNDFNYLAVGTATALLERQRRHRFSREVMLCTT